MWGKAEREATRRCALDWKHNLGEGRVNTLLVATSRGPNAVTLAYTARTMLIVGGSTLTSIRRVQERKGERRGAEERRREGREREREGREGKRRGEEGKGGEPKEAERKERRRQETEVERGGRGEEVCSRNFLLF